MTLNALLSSTSMIRVPRPRVLWVRRHLPDRVTVGDTAQSRLDPGTIALLDSPLGAGYLARYNIPVMLASTSAMAILAPACRGGIDWAGRNLEVEWFAVPGDHDVIVAEARLEQFSEQMARFATRGRTETGTVLYRGVLRQVALRDGIPAAYRSREEYEAAMASLARPTVELAAGKLLRVMAAPQSIPLGRSAAIEVEVSNHQRDPVALAVAAHAPFGAGLSFEAPEQQLVQLAPGGTASVRFTVRADRPHEVNLGKPWEARISAGDATVTIPILVPDPNPGRTFYLLTEDCETFDGGPLTGNYAGNEDLGNHNNFMDPEDYRVQMILKPARMNAIAERHGARWTHFYAATQRFAADWAAAQSTTGEWKKVAAEMDAAVRAGSQLHEYAPHIHYDYEPDSALAPQPRLVYDRATDGILPNDYYDPQTNPTHRYHDWDGAARGHSYIKPLGDFTVLDSKAGSMRKYLRHLSRIQANRRAPLVARTGSYDFGTTPEDQAISTEAYATNGLRGNSDVYRVGTPHSPGGQIFLCVDRDRHSAITDLRQTRLVQFAIHMDTDFQSAVRMNEWFAREWQATRGPGVHTILFTTHAMFLAGAPDRFRSLDGGTFDELDKHLAWVREQYPELEFATATEALIEYLDYFTPELSAVVEPRLCGGDPAEGRYEFPVRLLGKGIRVDPAHPAAVSIAAPAAFNPEELLEMRVRQDGAVIGAAVEFDRLKLPAVTVTLCSRASLRLEVVVRPEAVESVRSWFGESEFYDPPEQRGADVLRVRETIDVLRFLMNPVGGHHEPLGRRLHPMGGFSLSVAVTAAIEGAGGDFIPARVKLHWLHPVDLQSSFRTETQRTGENTTKVRILDDFGALVATAEVVLSPAPVLPPASLAATPQPDLAWQREFAAKLETYRSQRAWKAMLAFRKAYDLLLRRGWKGRIDFVKWAPGLMLGSPSGLEEYELEFPKLPHKN